jgi:hypothetical protein
MEKNCSTCWNSADLCSTKMLCCLNRPVAVSLNHCCPYYHHRTKTHPHPFKV